MKEEENEEVFIVVLLLITLHPFTRLCPSLYTQIINKQCILYPYIITRKGGGLCRFFDACRVRRVEVILNAKFSFKSGRGVEGPIYLLSN